MVSSVLVELMGDDDISWFISKELLEMGEAFCWWDIATAVC